MKISTTVQVDIEAERERQENKWGEQNHAPEWWAMILAEETGEAARALLEGDACAYRAKMIQAAAVAIAAIESLDRAVARMSTQGLEEAPFSSLAKLQKENKDLRDALEKVGKLASAGPLRRGQGDRK